MYERNWGRLGWAEERRTTRHHVADEEGRNGCCSRAGRRGGLAVSVARAGVDGERRGATGLAGDDQRLPRLSQPLSPVSEDEAERMQAIQHAPPARSPTGPSGATKTRPRPSRQRRRRGGGPQRGGGRRRSGRAVETGGGERWMSSPLHVGISAAPPRSSRLRHVARRLVATRGVRASAVLDVVRRLGRPGGLGPRPSCAGSPHSTVPLYPRRR